MRLTKTTVVAFAFGLCASFLPLSSLGQTPRWTPEKAKAWYSQQRWLVGANFVPKTAINPLEMWQADTFDPAEIDVELGYAEHIGMNTMRVFLHDQLWKQDPDGFKHRIDIFLTISQKHHIKPLFVLFDSCWDPDPKLGPQHPPIPGVHNSGWVQSPGRDMQNPEKAADLERYVKGVVGAFAKDDRILGWDVWNEPDNYGGGDYKQIDGPEKVGIVARLLPQVFEWARSVGPAQPLTSGVWAGADWSPSGKHSAVQDIQLQQSDFISFHNYDWPEGLEDRIKSLLPYGRPLLLTEYMARGNGSTFDTALPLARKYNVGAINWGLVKGKEQTHLPWDSWDRPYTKTQPAVWFHDVFFEDGTPYRKAEIDLIRQMTQAADKSFRKTD